MSEQEKLALEAKAWPFREARNLLKRLKGETPEKGYVLFETGYGPSGLPHIGTFQEVARTTMVMRAFRMMSDIPARLVCFSDDMDGFRKVPENMPNPDELEKSLGLPLSKVPDPFGEYDSFGAHNNARLQAFLDTFGFEYEFYSSTECYASGRFDEALMQILRSYDKIINVILPTLGEERRKTYSPFLPISPSSGRVLQVPMINMDTDAGTVTFEDENGDVVTSPVTGGHCKLQWKVDWAMRWHALDVDYEMAGKDLIESIRLSGIIRRILGGRPPEGFAYELFLDENGEKISKSRGNGLTIDEWLRYAAPESLALYVYQNPQRAKRLYFDVIPKAVDEYYTHLARYHGEEADKRLENPVFHIHGDDVPVAELPVSFAMLLNLVSTTNSEDKTVLWGFVSRYAPETSAETHAALDGLLDYAIAYYEDFVRPSKSYRLPDDQERAALATLAGSLREIGPKASAEDIQTLVYDAGKAHEFENLRDWFRALYETLLGQSQGPRMGGFIALYGIEETLALIDMVLDGKKVG